MAAESFTGWPDIDLAALRRGLAHSLVCWYGGRMIDRDGSGFVTVASVMPFLPAARSARSRVLRAGDGICWHRDGDRLALRALHRVAQSLGVKRLRAAYEGHRVWLRPSRHLRPGLTLNAAAILRNGRPASLALVAKLAGKHPRTVSRWLSMLSWPRRRNVVLLERVGASLVGHALRHADAIGARFNTSPGALTVVTDGRDLWLGRRLPNSLVAGTVKAEKRTALRRANKRLPTYDNSGRGHRQRYLQPGERRPKSVRSPSYHAAEKLPDGTQAWERSKSVTPVPEMPPILYRGCRGAGTPLREEVPFTLDDVVRILGPVEIIYDGPAPCPTCATRQAKGAGLAAVSAPGASDGA